jgi:hypothetical protein
MGLTGLGHVLMIMPVMIIQPLTTCAVEKLSPNNNTASIELNNGINVPNKAALPAPIF